jgi:hypothetical protein
VRVAGPLGKPRPVDQMSGGGSSASNLGQQQQRGSREENLELGMSGYWKSKRAAHAWLFFFFFSLHLALLLFRSRLLSVTPKNAAGTAVRKRGKHVSFEKIVSP